MTNRSLTVWQQITVEISGHPLSGSYAVEDGIVKVKTRASPFGAGITASFHDLAQANGDRLFDGKLHCTFGGFVG
jgi:hypothetical protein